MGKLNSNPFLSQKSDILNSLLYIPNIIRYSLEQKLIDVAKNILHKYIRRDSYLASVDRWYEYTYGLDISNEERQQLKELYQDYKDSDNVVKEIKWYINRLFNVDAPLYTQKQCIPEYYWKYLITFDNPNVYIIKFDPELNDTEWNRKHFFNQETYDLMEQQPLKAVLLGVEI